MIISPRAWHTRNGVIFMTKPYSDEQKGREVQKENLKHIARTLREMNQAEIASDILGSYTGLTHDGEQPEQDADDL